MATELTQLEREVSENPSVQYFSEISLSELNFEQWFSYATGLPKRFGKSTEKPKLSLPSRMGKKWDLFSSHCRSILVLLAKIQRDKKDPREETLAEDLLKKLRHEQEYCFRWEQERHNQEIAARRQGNMNVLLINAKQLTQRELEFLRKIIRQHIQSLISTHYMYQHHIATVKNVIFKDLVHSLLLFIDIPNLTEFAKKIPHPIQKKIHLVRLRVPKIYQEEKNELYDVLAEKFYLVLFNEPINKQTLSQIIDGLKKQDLLCFPAIKNTKFLLIFDPKFAENENTPHFISSIIRPFNNDLYFIEPSL